MAVGEFSSHEGADAPRRTGQASLRHAELRWHRGWNAGLRASVRGGAPLATLILLPYLLFLAVGSEIASPGL